MICTHLCEMVVADMIRDLFGLAAGLLLVIIQASPLPGLAFSVYIEARTLVVATERGVSHGTSGKQEHKLNQCVKPERKKKILYLHPTVRQPPS